MNLYSAKLAAETLENLIQNFYSLLRKLIDMYETGKMKAHEEIEELRNHNKVIEFLNSLILLNY